MGGLTKQKTASGILFGLFVLLAACAKTGVSEQAELAFGKWLESAAGKIADIMVAASRLGDPMSVIILCALLLVIPMTRMRAGIPAVASALISSLLNAILKAVFVRPRPELPWLVDAAGWSFPSGHAMNNAAVYVSLFLAAAMTIKSFGVKVSVCAACVAVPVVIGLSRVFAGVHYICDVMAGWALGALVALVIFEVYGGLTVKKRTPPLS